MRGVDERKGDLAGFTKKEMKCKGVSEWVVERKGTRARGSKKGKKRKQRVEGGGS